MRYYFQLYLPLWCRDPSTFLYPSDLYFNLLDSSSVFFLVPSLPSSARPQSDSSPCVWRISVMISHLVQILMFPLPFCFQFCQHFSAQHSFPVWSYFMHFETYFALTVISVHVGVPLCVSGFTAQHMNPRADGLADSGSVWCWRRQVQVRGHEPVRRGHRQRQPQHRGWPRAFRSSASVYRKAEHQVRGEGRSRADGGPRAGRPSAHVPLDEGRQGAGQLQSDGHCHQGEGRSLPHPAGAEGNPAHRLLLPLLLPLPMQLLPSMLLILIPYRSFVRGYGWPTLPPACFKMLH